MIIYVWIFCLIFTGFLLLFGRIRWVETAKSLLSRTKKGMDQSARLRVLENRHKLQELQRNNTWICRVEEFLCYCGMRRRFPACTPEKWIAGNLLGMTVIFGVLLGSSGKFLIALSGIMISGAVEYLFLSTLRAEELRMTNENLLKCLNFLGNYSLTAGEITMVLGQVSRYVEEPLKGALEECAYEAQTTGDSSLALLSMAERIEHPKIKELARNLEISIRYMADLTTLVDSSRRSAREYLRMEGRYQYGSASGNVGIRPADGGSADRCVGLENSIRDFTGASCSGCLWTDIVSVFAETVWFSPLVREVWRMSWRVIWIPELLGAVLGGIFVFRLGMGTMPKTVLHACEEVTGMLRENRRYENWVTGTEKKLRKNGAKFHYGKKITPVKYLLMRLFLSLGAVLALGTIGWGYALLAAMGLYYVPELLLLYLNRQDNRKMMPDLQLIYQALEVQTCAGVYVTDALTECCQSVRTQRLQQALMELSGDLVIQSDLVTALSDFQQKFDNRQIDALCITLIQAGESGQAVDLLKDMGEQLKDMELTVLQQQKSALDRSITFYQLGMLGAVLGIILYACVGYMFRAVVQF